MPTMTKYATGHTLVNVSTATNPTNAYAGIGNSTYTSIYGRPNGDIEGYVEYYGFNFSSIPDGSIINSVTFREKAQQFCADPEVYTYPTEYMTSQDEFFINGLRKGDFIFNSSEGLQILTLTMTGIALSDLKASPEKNYFRIESLSLYGEEIRVYGLEISVDYTLPTYAISSSAGEGGSISPSGTTNVTHGNNQTYTITPNSGYAIETLTVDGLPITPVLSYTFNCVTELHSISATFKQLFNPTIAAAKQSEWFLKGR